MPRLRASDGRYAPETICPRCGRRAVLAPQTDPARPAHIAFGDLCSRCETALDELCGLEGAAESDPRSSAEVAEAVDEAAFERSEDAHRCPTCAVAPLGDDCPDCFGEGFNLDDEQRARHLARLRALDEEEICHACNGSGEGRFDGSRCHHCG